jgi:predicted nucleotidyltransferase
MSGVCSLDPGARQVTLRELTRLAEALRRDFAIDAVYVFGSFARGQEHEGSDLDLLVVGNLPGRAFDRVGEILRRTMLPVEPIVVRRETLERRLAAEHPLFVRAMEEGLRLL